ncbi:TPA: hypothetical protein NH844_003157 [Pseudomonas aeruginosa]|nr:hypothetical protein [Pseudomonas aeruginosa]
MSDETNFESYKKSLSEYFSNLLGSVVGANIVAVSDIREYHRIKQGISTIEVNYNQHHHKVNFIEFEHGRTCRVKLTHTHTFKSVKSQKLKKTIIADFISENSHLSDLICLDTERSGKIRLYQGFNEQRLSIYLYNHETKKYDSQVLNVGVGVVIFASHHFFRSCESNRKKINRREEMPNVIRMGNEFLIEMDDEILELAQMIAY